MLLTLDFIDLEWPSFLILTSQEITIVASGVLRVDFTTVTDPSGVWLSQVEVVVNRVIDFLARVV